MFVDTKSSQTANQTLNPSILYQIDYLKKNFVLHSQADLYSSHCHGLFAICWTWNDWSKWISRMITQAMSQNGCRIKCVLPTFFKIKKNRTNPQGKHFAKVLLHHIRHTFDTKHDLYYWTEHWFHVRKWCTPWGTIFWEPPKYIFLFSLGNRCIFLILF